MWDRLWLSFPLFQVKAAREKLGRPCDMCNNYEAQLQSVQGKEREVMERMRTLEKQVSGTKQALEKQKKYAEELETSLKNAAEDAQAQVWLLSLDSLSVYSSITPYHSLARLLPASLSW